MRWRTRRSSGGHSPATDVQPTLTPTSFQNERRDFWQAQKDVREMSPFFYADKMQGGDPDVSLDRGPERRHGPDQLDSHDAGDAGERKDRIALHVSV